jgi:hypothetical protein
MPDMPNTMEEMEANLLAMLDRTIPPDNQTILLLMLQLTMLLKNKGIG